MISKKEALFLEEQLHPAFAGYLHDGEITYRDVIATIIYLIKSGILDPIWKDNHMLKKLQGIRVLKKKPLFLFEKQIIQQLFKERNEVDCQSIGDIIAKGVIQNTIKDNLHAIEAFPIIQSELKFTLGKTGEVQFSLNGQPVKSIEMANNFKRTLIFFILPFFIIIGGFMTLMFSLTKHSAIEEIIPGSPTNFIITPLIMLGVLGFIFFLFFFSRKEVKYKFKDHIVPIAKEKYDQLFEFIKANPLPSHRLTNEFLPFAIAFGLDDSWNKDFGLDKEFQVEMA